MDPAPESPEGKSSELLRDGKLVPAFEVLRRTDIAAGEKGLQRMRKLAEICGLVVAQRNEEAQKVLQDTDVALSAWTKSCKSANSPLLLETAKLKILLLTLWADFHKSENRQKLALSCLKKAVSHSKRLALPREKRLSKAKSLLNISALYSEMSKSAAAISASRRALRILQKDIATAADESSFSRDVAASVVVAFYNIGAAEEMQGKKEEMVEAYRAGLAVGAKYLRKDHELMAMTRCALQESEFHPSPRLMTSAHFKSLLKERKAELEPSASGSFSARSKYYSDSQLNILKAKRGKSSGLDFVSSDEYFKRRIGQALGALKPVPTAELLGEREEKVRLNSLRARRKPVKGGESGERGPVRVKEEMFHLQIKAAELAQKNDVRMLSRSKTKGFRQALNSLAMRDQGSRPYVPPQRLFFKRTDSETVYEEPPATGEDPSNHKEELEKLMDEVKLDIDHLDALKHPDAKSARSLRVPMKSASSDLARSTFRRVSSLKVKTAAISIEAVNELAQVVDRKKIQKEAAKPVQRLRSPMEFPYKSRF